MNGVNTAVRYGLKFEEHSNSITAYSVEHETEQPLECMNMLPSYKQIDEFIHPENYPIVIRPVLNYRYFYTLTDPSIVTVRSQEPQMLMIYPHDLEKCSLCSGPNNLHKREPIAIIQSNISKRHWEFHWNIAPQDYFGHYLIIPKLNIIENTISQ